MKLFKRKNKQPVRRRVPLDNTAETRQSPAYNSYMPSSLYDNVDESASSNDGAGEPASFDLSQYRRGTTLSTFKSNDLTKTERQKLKRLRTLRRRLAGAMALVIVLIMLGITLISQFTNTITAASGSRGVQLSAADVKKYEDIINEYFAKNSFERFSFARRSSVLEQYVEAKAPEVKGLKIIPDGITTGRAILQFREPVAMWVSGNSASFVDSGGRVFERNYYSTPSISIQDDSGITSIGNTATSSSFLSFVGKTAVEIQKTNGLQIERVVIPKGSARYVEIYLSGRNYPFKAQISRDAVGQAADIAVMVRYIDSHGIQPQYVDCRVAGKAYWK